MNADTTRRIARVDVRPMTAGDLATVAELERLIYPQPWSLRVFEDEMTQPGRVYLVAEDGGHIVGYAGVMVIDDDAHVTTLAVDPTNRRGRLGSRLMLRLVDAVLDMGAKHMTLEVRMSNQAAQRLYAKFGLAPVGVRKEYYGDEDALVMWAIDIDGTDYSTRLASLRRDLETADA